MSITTPEAFNINKWDDVTTSEIYGLKSTLLKTVVADGVKTGIECLNELISGINVNANKEYLYIETDVNSHRIILHSTDVVPSSGRITFGITEINVSSLVIGSTTLKENKSSVKLCTITTNGNVTISNSGSQVETSGYKHELYELSTI